MRARSHCAALLASVTLALAQSQPRPLQFDIVYSCSSGRTKLKVLNCTGTAETDSCDAQYIDPAAPQGLGAKISASRKSLTGLLQTCVIEKAPAQAPSAPPPAAAAPAQASPSRVPARQAAPRAAAPANRPAAAEQQPASPARPTPPAPARQAETFGFKLGDTVEIAVGVGWTQGKIVAFYGNNFGVRTMNGIAVMKTYPAEVRRIGGLTKVDRANGVYNAGERVQVLFEGHWVDSKIETIMGTDYQVHLPGNRLGWTTAQNIRPATAAPPPPPKTRGAPCGSKLEGRWGSAAGLGGVSLEIRGGKAYMEGPLAPREMLDCVIAGDKIFLTKPGEPNELDFHVNDDGTIDAGVFGDLRKKGK